MYCNIIQVYSNRKTETLTSVNVEGVRRRKLASGLNGPTQDPCKRGHSKKGTRPDIMTSTSTWGQQAQSGAESVFSLQAQNLAWWGNLLQVGKTASKRSKGLKCVKAISCHSNSMNTSLPDPSWLPWRTKMKEAWWREKWESKLDKLWAHLEASQCNLVM